MWSRSKRRRGGLPALRWFVEQALRRRAAKRRRPGIEGLESRCVSSASLPNIALLSASTTDSWSVTVDYTIDGLAPSQPFELRIYRSADDRFDPEDRLIGSQVIYPEPDHASIDLADEATRSGRSGQVTVTLADGIPPHPSQPYVLVVADPENAVAESDETDNTVAFRKHLIGVVVHGGIQESKSNPPAWALRLASALRDLGYDVVIPYNWAAESWTPGAAAKQGPRVANLVRQASSRFPETEPVDLHLIAHSQGAVVASQALVALGRHMTPQLQAGYLKVTLLDPHAANNNAPGGQYSVSSGLDGWIAEQAIRAYHALAKDPLVVVPDHVDAAEVYHQHTPVSINGANNGTYNLWGQVPVGGQACYCNLTGPGISHSGETGVQAWYYFNVVPTLRDGSSFVCPTTLTGRRDPDAGEVTTRGAAITGDRQPTYLGTAAPGVPVRLLAERAGQPTAILVGRTVADDHGRWSITSRPLAPGSYRMSVQGIVPSGPPRPRTHMFPRVPLERLIVPPR